MHTHWPTKDTVVKWIHEHEEFADLIIEATVCQIIDDWGKKAIYRKEKNGKLITNNKILAENGTLFFSKNAGRSSSYNLLQQQKNEHGNCVLNI